MIKESRELCPGGKFFKHQDELSFLSRVEVEIGGEWQPATIIRQASPLNPVICLQPERGVAVEIDTSNTETAIQRLRPEGFGKGQYLRLEVA